MESRPGSRAVRKGSVAGRIALEGVGFRYPSTETPVLRDVDSGRRAGRDDRPGRAQRRGQDDLVQPRRPLLRPDRRSVRLDGIDLRDVEVESYRRLLGIVEQDVFLFDGSVAENIAYAARRATQGRGRAGRPGGHAAEFIEALPEGYDTLIGERGVRLSGGQRQRLAIARAVLADPVIFILDEATSNLDSHSERLIQRGLARPAARRTSFVIAHRLSTIRGGRPHPGARGRRDRRVRHPRRADGPQRPLPNRDQVDLSAWRRRLRAFAIDVVSLGCRPLGPLERQ
jgi:ATP-binding cassette subfamily B protein/subfamily B ATP-binding cassette protein MsbA